MRKEIPTNELVLRLGVERGTREEKPTFDVTCRVGEVKPSTIEMPNADGEQVGFSIIQGGRMIQEAFVETLPQPTPELPIVKPFERSIDGLLAINPVDDDEIYTATKALVSEEQATHTFIGRSAIATFVDALQELRRTDQRPEAVQLSRVSACVIDFTEEHSEHYYMGNTSLSTRLSRRSRYDLDPIDLTPGTWPNFSRYTD